MTHSCPKINNEYDFKPKNFQLVIKISPISREKIKTKIEENEGSRINLEKSYESFKKLWMLTSLVAYVLGSRIRELP